LRERHTRLQKLILGVSALFVAAGPAMARDVVVHAGTLIECVAATPRQRVSILIKDDRITAITAGFVTPAGAEVIDMVDATVMSGFIDAHIHITAKLPSRTNATEDWLTHSDIDHAFDGAKFARAMLQQGFTAARDVGGGPDTVALRNAINSGKVAGSGMWVSLEAIGSTAGHGDARYGMDPQLSHPGWDSSIVDSPDQARARVREHQRRGPDLIKIMPSGGIASSGDDPRQKLMDDDEIWRADGLRHRSWRRRSQHRIPPFDRG
jgi:imidazolonepropionase-like amidohydrolase